MKTASEIAKTCKNCKEAKEMFKSLVSEGNDREMVRRTIKKACELISKRNEKLEAENNEARQWLREYDNILRAVAPEYFRSKEFKQASKGCQFKGSVLDFVKTYFPKVTKSGIPVVVKYEVLESGETFKRYRKVTKSRSAAFSVLDACTKSLLKSRIGTFKQVVF